jgi:hypothetical protein
MIFATVGFVRFYDFYFFQHVCIESARQSAGDWATGGDAHDEAAATTAGGAWLKGMFTGGVFNYRCRWSTPTTL